MFLDSTQQNRSIVVGYTIDELHMGLLHKKKRLTIAGDTSGTWLTTNGTGMYFGWSLGLVQIFTLLLQMLFKAGFKMAKTTKLM